MNDNTIQRLANKALLEKIEERIRWDRRISTADITIIVNEGHVVLNGTVDDEFRNLAANEIVLSTEGVHSLENRVFVPKHFERSDRMLHMLLQTQIAGLGLAETEYINVSVTRGAVKLDGIVHSKRKKSQAAGMTWELSGVKDCLNLVKIAPPRRQEKNDKESLELLLHRRELRWSESNFEKLGLMEA